MDPTPDRSAGAAADAAIARLRRARAFGSSDEVITVYRDWAEHYDRDVFEVLGVIGSQRIADLLAAHQPDRAGAVIDLGCGTGVVGAHLCAHGFAVVDGVDISPEMLAVAERKGCYRTTVVADLTDADALPVGWYRASVSAGTFTTGHVGADAVPALIGLHEPGAVVAWVIAEPVWPAFASALASQGVETLHAALEPIRAGGPPESVMFVGRTASRGRARRRSARGRCGG